MNRYICGVFIFCGYRSYYHVLIVDADDKEEMKERVYPAMDSLHDETYIIKLLSYRLPSILVPIFGRQNKSRVFFIF